jgi:hypothetical protein
MPDRPFQRVPGDLQRPGGVAGRELAERRPDITRAKVTQQPGADPFEHRLQQALVEGVRALRRAIKPLAKPVIDGLARGVGARGPDSCVQLLVQRLELGSDFLPGLAGDLPPDPLPVRPVADRDRTHVRVHRGVQVDPVVAEPAAPDFRLGHGESTTL